MQDNKWLSTNSMFEYLHINRDTVMNWIKKEGIPAHEKESFWCFDINELYVWMKIVMLIKYPMPISY